METKDPVVKVMISMPDRLKQAAVNEADRRCTDLSGFIKQLLIPFLPQNIGAPINDKGNNAR